MLVKIFQLGVSKPVIEGVTNDKSSSSKVENTSFEDDHEHIKHEIGEISTAHSISENPSHLQMSFQQKVLVKCAFLYDKFSKFANSKSCKNILMGAAVLNALQLLIFFMFGIFILPVQTSRRLSTGDVYFIMEHVPDEYIDYNYFKSQTIL